MLPTVRLCPACHKFLHKTFSNAELAGEFNSLDALLEREEVQSFVAWIKKQPATRGRQGTLSVQTNGLADVCQSVIGQ